ncbi:L-fucose isomerase 2 domain protein [Pseudopedobacter saltans DSM 12145]|uniref:L-fucose isomerase 2 domain protein n=1 Tax=Pseudopedobacter saltans (strain ATCC 51119 / DSM 12145 / JCM 21818 / CCUG 39354 / LMG 10337 / NBRC 100064 / NCIMB 13643) TaxID=762903 RepID=F0S5A1_PSESL|nr:fucose isomerase [Pseudopedobacter saltans]ADY52046.1 L-fucose isomerase 2 domain protein [Pseudopedobacter saltans DSM 12145]
MNTQKKISLVCSGDLRPSANLSCWAAQSEMERQLAKAFEAEGWTVERAHGFDEEKQHGFIDSQRMGIEVFKNIDPQSPLVVAESVWQYSHHVLAGLTTHKGPILIVANWSGEFPGLVGALNLTGSLTKAGVNYSFLWSEDFTDEFFKNGLNEWLTTGKITHDYSHVKSLTSIALPKEDEQKGRAFGAQMKANKAIMGVFDEGCMGMFNAIVPDDLLHATGIFKERLSQSTLYAKMLEVSDEDAEKVLAWLLNKGMKFDWGTDEVTELTRNQTLIQCKMYIAALRLADEFGCDTIGIQYQQGLKDLAPASDLVEGILNNQDRPPVFNEKGKELFAGEALPHFNEVDECAGIDGLLTYHLWKELGMAGENTLHDLRWGQNFNVNGADEFVWVFLISGAAPPAHHIGGYAGSDSIRQPAMFFRKGGGTLRGIAKPGHLVWSRVFVQDNQLHCDIGVGKAVELPKEETERRWNLTNPQWPIMHATLDGVSRDQMMARHKANHIQVVYANDEVSAHKACRIKAAALAELGIQVHFCGNVDAEGVKFV